jgi:hypothetical protein
MNASTPTIIEGKTFSKYNINLSINSLYKDGSQDPEGTVALRLIPIRFDENNLVVKSENNYKSVLLENLKNSDLEDQQAINQIYSAIQNYINVKGL